MTGLVRKATLLTACGLLVAAAAMAGVPDPANSTKPTRIYVLGTSGGTADPLGNFTVVVRDLASNPIANSSVVIDLANCTDTELSNINEETDPSGFGIAGQTLDCALETVRAFTDATGSVTINIQGAARNATGASQPGAGQGCVRIIADGVLLGTANAEVGDHNGFDFPLSDGVAINDGSRVLVDFGSGIYKSRSDFNRLAAPGTLGIDDVSAWLSQVFGPGQSSSGTFAAGFCP